MDDIYIEFKPGNFGYIMHFYQNYKVVKYDSFKYVKYGSLDRTDRVKERNAVKSLMQSLF